MDRFQCLAEILLDTQWTSNSLEKAIVPFSVPRSKARKRLSAAILLEFKTPPSRSVLAAYLEKHKLCEKLIWSEVEGFRLQNIERNRMRRAVDAPFAASIPTLPTVGKFAEWCDTEVGLVDWLAQHRKDHYRVSTTPKRSGGLRIVEAPRARLKAVQRKIATEILQTIPCHSAAHGFVRGRSALSYVQPHVGQPVLLRMDLQDFFPSIAASRVFGLFRSIGYPYATTQLLTNLCTATCSEEKLKVLLPDGWQSQPNLDRCWQLRSLYCRKHLPQGAPTSPALANLIAFRLDCRLAGLARSVGINYTRYADDLLFSGSEKFGRVAKAFAIKVGSIALDEGFQIQFRKTRIMRAATRQTAAGIVLNRCTNLNRIEYDRLKAILCNCVRLGPSTQNRDKLSDFEAHLRGRVNWVRQLHQARGEKLTAMFNAIDWSK